jgi:hypothetical protein
MKIVQLKIVHRSSENTLNVVTISYSSKRLFRESEGGLAMTEVVIHPHLTTKAWVQSHSSSCGQSGNGTGFSLIHCSAVSISPMLFTHSLTHSFIHSFIHSPMMNALIMNCT